MKTWKWLIAGGIVTGLFVWWKAKQLQSFAKYLSISPKIDGGIKKVSIKDWKVNIPLAVEFANNSEAEVSVSLPALIVSYKGKQVVTIEPNLSTCSIKANTKSELSGITAQIPVGKLISVAGNVITTLITGGDTAALMADVTVAGTLLINNSIVYDFDMALGASKTLEVAKTGNNANLVGLGLVAKKQRKIYSLSTYENLLPSRDNLKYEDYIYNENGSVTDTVTLIKRIIAKYHTDVAHLALNLKGATRRITCQRIFDWIYTHIQYVPDKAGVEQLRRPLRTIYDQKGDCDCYTILIGSLLTELGIPFKIRIAAYNLNRGFQHVYIIVPEGSGYYAVDPVLDECFTEHPYLDEKTF